MSNIQLFDNGEFELRVTPANDTFTVSGPGLARSLAFRSATDMVRHLPADEKGSVLEQTLGGMQQVWFVTEPGFYHVIGQRQPGRIKDAALRAQVERFQRWVHHDVLPAIRKTGSYHIVERRSAIDLTPDTYTYDEVCAVLRQDYGIRLTVHELTRNLRAGGVLKQNGAPTKKYDHLFWFTTTCWHVQKHLVRQIAYKVYETGRELQDFRFLQARLELEGFGWPTDQAAVRAS